MVSQQVTLALTCSVPFGHLDDFISSHCELDSAQPSVPHLHFLLWLSSRLCFSYQTWNAQCTCLLWWECSSCLSLPCHQWTLFTSLTCLLEDMKVYFGLCGGHLCLQSAAHSSSSSGHRIGIVKFVSYLFPLFLVALRSPIATTTTQCTPLVRLSLSFHFIFLSL